MRRFLSGLVLGLLLGVALGLLLGGNGELLSKEDRAAPREGEATYQGKPTCHWLAQLHDRDAAFRQKAAYALGEIGVSDPTVLPALLVALHDPDHGVLLKDKADTISPQHFALRVTDVAAARTYFRERGIPTQETTPIPGADRFFISDPDGNRIEIIQWLRPYSSEENAPV
jgi:catechol 2,3-dioxygenase-like lactoylglutathione lyase family enzyme